MKKIALMLVVAFGMIFAAGCTQQADAQVVVVGPRRHYYHRYHPHRYYWHHRYYRHYSHGRYSGPY